ncbi:DUF3631 domain-containing protein [Streptomyces sp. SID13726]|uniref:DUF3631 domain-containing protein n=1 Tax=Streptomyces sp. SID13726 TaxID=2706058 RepID=UPI0013B6701B|nr:DUF3631 domain-containing protein [Streptomyces sp. SID13726]NEB01953.1 DUF3631 domain-containing protein [Streptomyces sp. SID13726]
MTQFPSLNDQVAAVLAPAPAAENPHHRTLVAMFVEIHLDRRLADLAGAERPAGVTATQRLDQLTDLLIERMAAGAELSTLLSNGCCCAAAYEPEPPSHDEPEDDGEPDGGPDSDPEVDPAAEDFDIFDDRGSAQGISTAELVARLRARPGEAEGRWRYTDLTPVRLAMLLRPHGMTSRKPRTAAGSRYRACRRSDLQAARPDCSW